MDKTSIITDRETVRKLRDLAPDGNVSGFLRSIANDPKLIAERMTAESAVIRVLQRQIEKLQEHIDKIYDEYFDLRIHLDAFDFVLGPRIHRKVKNYELERKSERREWIREEEVYRKEYPTEYARYENLLKDWIEDKTSDESDTIDPFADIMPDFKTWMDYGMPDKDKLRDFVEREYEKYGFLGAFFDHETNEEDESESDEQ